MLTCNLNIREDTMKDLYFLHFTIVLITRVEFHRGRSRGKTAFGERSSPWNRLLHDVRWIYDDAGLPRDRHMVDPQQAYLHHQATGMYGVTFNTADANPSTIFGCQKRLTLTTPAHSFMSNNVTSHNNSKRLK